MPPLDAVDEPGRPFRRPLGAEDVVVVGEVGAGVLAPALQVPPTPPPMHGELGPVGPGRPVAVDLDDVELRRPRFVVRLAPEGGPGAVAARRADPGLPVAELLGELVLGVDTADAPRIGPLGLALDPLEEDAAADHVVGRVAPAVIAVRRRAPAEAAGPFLLVERRAVELVGEGQHPLGRLSIGARLLRTNWNGRPGRRLGRPLRSHWGARRSGYAPPGAGGPGGVPRGGRDISSCDEQHQREGQCGRRPTLKRRPRAAGHCDGPYPRSPPTPPPPPSPSLPGSGLGRRRMQASPLSSSGIVHCFVGQLSTGSLFLASGPSGSPLSSPRLAGLTTALEAPAGATAGQHRQRCKRREGSQRERDTSRQHQEIPFCDAWGRLVNLPSSKARGRGERRSASSRTTRRGERAGTPA